jgi:hypothetical protein
MFHGMGSAAMELILTNKSEDQLTSKLMTGFVVGIVMTVLGALMSIAGLGGALLGM